MGAVLVVLNVRVPRAFINSLNLIGEPTTGISLFVVGIIIAEEKVRLTGRLAIDAVLKNLVQPLAMLATVLVFGVHGTLAREAVLLAALPSGRNHYYVRRRIWRSRIRVLHGSSGDENSLFR